MATDKLAGLEEAQAELSRLQEFLQNAPADLHDWARSQIEAAEAEVSRLEAEQARRDELKADAQEADLLGLDGDDLASPSPSADAGNSTVSRRRRPWYLHPAFLVVLSAALLLAVFIYGDRTQPMPEGHPSTGASKAEPSAQPSIDVQLLAGLEAKVEKDPKDVTSWRALGEMYHKLAAYDKAIAAQKAILAVDPKDENAALALGLAQYYSKDIKNAEATWLKLTQMNPGQANAWFNLGYLYYGMKEQAKSDAAWRKVIEIDPKSTMSEQIKMHNPALAASTPPTPSSTPS